MNLRGFSYLCDLLFIYEKYEEKSGIKAFFKTWN